MLREWGSYYTSSEFHPLYFSTLFSMMFPFASRPQLVIISSSRFGPINAAAAPRETNMCALAVYESRACTLFPAFTAVRHSRFVTHLLELTFFRQTCLFVSRLFKSNPKWRKTSSSLLRRFLKNVFPSGAYGKNTWFQWISTFVLAITWLLFENITVTRVRDRDIIDPLWLITLPPHFNK